MAATTELTPEAARNSTSLDVEKAPPAPVQQQDAEEEYPEFKKLIFILIAIYLSMFIVALVGIPLPQHSSPGVTLTDPYSGSNYSGHSHPQDHGRFPCHYRCWMVR
jgi:hypothetical protein